MPILRFTDLSIKALPPGMYWDDLLPAFGVRVGKNRKTFMVMKGRTRTRVKIGLFGPMSLQEARKRARALLEPSDTANAVPDKRSVAQAVVEYLSRTGVRPTTLYDYRKYLNNHLVAAIGAKELASVGPRDIIPILDGLKSKPTARLNCHVALGVFFTWCVKRMYLASSPMAPLARPPKPKSRERLLTDTEVVHIWTASFKVGEPFGAIVRVCLLSGQRRGEISQLRSDWLMGDTLVIPADVAKNGVQHTIPCSQLLLQNTVTISNYGSQFSGWSKSKKRLDGSLPHSMPAWTLHDLRRYFSSTMAKLGVPIDVTEALLNHVSGSRSPLQRIYDRHDRLPEMRAALDKYHAHLLPLLSAS